MSPSPNTALFYNQLRMALGWSFPRRSTAVSKQTLQQQVCSAGWCYDLVQSKQQNRRGKSDTAGSGADEEQIYT